jgi:DNA replication protein DnaC
MSQITKIADYLSLHAITESPRFNFQVPDTVEGDLLQCYGHAVRASGVEMQLTDDTKKVLRSVANWLRSGRRGLLLSGSCGTGKTKVIQALSYLFDFYGNGRNGLRVHSAAKIAEMCVSKAEGDASDLGMLKTAKYVGIDDVGTEPVSVKNWGTEILPVADIIYCRYNAMKVTVMSTNLGMEKIRTTYGDRIYDRICEMCEKISFNFQSFRQR